MLQELVNVQSLISNQERNIDNLRQYQMSLSSYYQELLEHQSKTQDAQKALRARFPQPTMTQTHIPTFQGITLPSQLKKPMPLQNHKMPETCGPMESQQFGQERPPLVSNLFNRMVQKPLMQA